MDRRKMKKIIDEIKSEAVKINGLKEMLREVCKFLTEDDQQLIEKELERKGLICGWDKLLDTLKYCDVNAFLEYINVINSWTLAFKCPDELLQNIAYVFSNCGLNINDYLRGRVSGDGRRQSRRSSSASAGWSSIDSNDSIDVEGNGLSAARKHEYFRSTSQKGSHGRHTSSNSVGSMDENKPLSLDTSISNLPVKIRRQLGEKLDHETSLHKDWRRVAECLNMSQDEIIKIKDSNMLTAGVITEMSYRTMNVSDLVRILLEIGRHDCVSLFKEEGVDLTPLGIEIKGDEKNSPRSTDEDVAPIPESTKDADPQVKAKGTAKSFDQESGDSDLEESCDPFQESFNEALKADKNIPQLKNMPLGKAEKFQSAEPGFRGSDYIETYRDTDEKRVAGYEKSLKTPTYDQRERSKSETKDLKSASNSSMKGAKSKSLEIPNYPGVSAQSALHRETPGDDASSKRIDVQEGKFTSVDEVDLEESKDEVVEEVSETGMKKEALYRNFEQLPNSVSPKQSTLSSIKEDDRKFVHYTLPMILPTGRSITTTNSSRTGYPVISSRGGTGPEIHTGSLPSQYAGILKEVGPKQESANIKVDGDQFTANNDIIEKMTTQNTTGDSADSRGEPRKNEICNSLLLMSPAQEEEDSEVIFKKNNASHISFADSADSRDEPRKDEIFNSRLSMSPAQEEEESEVTFKKNNASHTSFADLADSRDDPRKNKICNSLPSMSPAQEEAVPSQSSPSLVDSPPSESKEGTSSRSTFSSFISSVFEKLGLGRQPVFPGEANAASRNSPGMPFPQSGISNSEVAIEHNESGVGEVGDTSLKTLKGNFVSDSEKKINRRFEGNLKDQLKEGCLALLINNFDYGHLQKLPANNSMEDLAKELKLCGWQVEVQSNLSKQQLENATKSFAEKSKKKTALLYYFGHAVQIHGENYILPIDFESQAVKTKAYMKRSAVSMDDVILLRMTVAEASVIIVDAAGSLDGSTNDHGLARVKERQNQCVLFTSSALKKRFMANLLKERLQESEAITCIREWIAPFRNDFEAFACSRRLLPLPVKVPSEGWNMNLFHSANNEIRRLAFLSKANATIESVGLTSKWIVNPNKDGNDLETDFNIFLKAVDSEKLAFYLFYYEGAVEMENGELLLNQPGLTPTDGPPSLALILESLSETVLGPRVIIVNSTEGDFDVTDFGTDQYNLQETFLMVSSPHRERSQTFYDELIATLAQENIDIEHELLRLSESYSFRVFKNSLFNI